MERKPHINNQSYFERENMRAWAVFLQNKDSFHEDWSLLKKT